MRPLYLQSEEALCNYFRKFLTDKPQAVQLDGSATRKPNTGIYVIFEYSVTGKKYKLSGELPRQAIEALLQLVDEHGDAGTVLKETPHGELTLADPQLKVDWVCKTYIDKASEKFKKIA